MGSMMTVDPWLLDLGGRSQWTLPVARDLARMQATVGATLGHLPALNDKYIKEKVTKAALRGEMARVMVRCIRCHAVASLKDWCYSAAMDDEERERKAAVVRRINGSLPASFLQPCLGGEQASQRVAMLDDMTIGGEA